MEGGGNVGDLARRSLQLAFVFCAGISIACLIAGLLASWIQTQLRVQEPTLSLVPRLLIGGGVAVLLLEYGLGSLTEYAEAVFVGLASAGR